MIVNTSHTIRLIAPFHLLIDTKLSLIRCLSSAPGSRYQYIKYFVLVTFRSTTMDSKYFQKCSIVFHLFGQNSYNSHTNKTSVWLQHIPRTLFVLLVAGIICRHGFFGGNGQKPEPLIFYMILTMNFTINALVFLEYFVVPNGVQRLCCAYKQAIACLERRLCIRIDYKSFRRSFRLHLSIIFCTFLLTLTVKIVFFLYGNGSITEFILLFLYYLKHFTTLHILFHVELVHCLLHAINIEFGTIEQHDSAINTVQPKTIELLLTLRNCKCAHFRIWTIFRILNIRFGWILIALMLATLLDISYSSYWIWIFIHKSRYEHIKIHRLMRKYFFFPIY